MLSRKQGTINKLALKSLSPNYLKTMPCANRLSVCKEGAELEER